FCCCMKKIELEIVALSHSITQTHSYAVVLGEINGLRRLPIVIGGFETQANAVALERLQPTRPLIHDLLKNFMMAFEINLHEIVISNLQEGIFYSKLVCSSNEETVEIDSRTSDALALAVRFGCPIYIFEDILAEAALIPEEEAPKTSEGATEETASDENLSHLSVDELNTMLSEVLEHEDYIKAIAIRDELKRRQKK